jgi:hypothetical protein
MSVDAPGPGYQVDTPSLRTDAAHWSTAAGTLSRAATAAETLHLEPRAFSYLACWATGIDQVYADLQTKLTRLLQQGTGAFTDIAAALTETATTYDRAEDGAVTEIRQAGQGVNRGR